MEQFRPLHCFCVSFFVFIFQIAYSQAPIPFNPYPGIWGSASMAGGHLTSNNADNYQSGAEHRLDADGHYVQLFHDVLSSGSFQVKLIAKVGAGAWQGDVRLQESPDGSTWTTLVPEITSIGNNGASVNLTRTLSNGTAYVRVFYFDKISGSNLGVDDFGVSGTILPIEISAFYAKAFEGLGRIIWQTASELNSSHFSIEKSTDGSKFREIGIVPSNGTTNETHDYEFIDESPSPGTNYYRLRQEDFDSRFEYSKVVSIHFDNGGSVQLYPTLAEASVNLRFTKPTEETSRLLMFDFGGRLVHQQDIEPETELLSVSTDDLMPGQYLARVQSGRTVENLRFVKQ
jgi:hypothetical protein